MSLAHIPADPAAVLHERPSRPVPVDEEPPWPDAVVARPRDTRPAGEAFRTTDLSTFLEEPEPEAPMLVEGIGLPAVGTIILGGPPKSLKTLLMTQLALCVSTVDDEGAWMPFLDFPIVRGGPVLFVEEEGGRDPLRRRIARQRAGLGADGAIEFLLYAGVRLDDESTFRRLVTTAKRIEPALLVLDPFAFLHGQDENKPAAMAPIMRRLSRLSNEATTCVVVIMHTTKPQADRPAGRLGDRIRGASSITAGADGFYLLDRKGADRAQLRGEFRDHESVDVLVELDPETLVLRRVDEPKAPGRIDPDELVAYVRERGQVTRSQVAERFEVRSKNTAQLYLEEHPSIDWYDGPRNTRFYRVRTDQ